MMSSSSRPFLLLLLLSSAPPAFASGGHTIIGAGEDLDILAVSKALVGIIFFTVAYEYLTESIERRLEHTPYMKIVNQVYKELTVMGLISFAVFMLGQYSTYLVDNPVNLLAFEYAHILIFFVALMIIITAAYLCAVNHHTSKNHLKSELQTTDDLMADYKKVMNESRWKKFLYHNWLMPSNLRHHFEIKLLHNFFIEAYFVPPSFDFGMYVKYNFPALLLSSSRLLPLLPLLPLLRL